MCKLCELKAMVREQLQDEQTHRQVEAELALVESRVNINNAEAISKLVEAADILHQMGQGSRADRVLLQLDAILPQREERRANQVSPAEEPEQTELAGQAGESQAVRGFQILTPQEFGEKLALLLGGIDPTKH